MKRLSYERENFYHPDMERPLVTKKGSLARRMEIYGEDVNSGEGVVGTKESLWWREDVAIEAVTLTEERVLMREDAAVYNIPITEREVLDGLAYSQELEALLFTSNGTIQAFDLNTLMVKTFCSAPLQIKCISSGFNYIACATTNFIQLVKISTKQKFHITAPVCFIKSIQIMKQHGRLEIHVMDVLGGLMCIAYIVEREDDIFQVNHCYFPSCAPGEPRVTYFYDQNKKSISGIFLEDPVDQGYKSTISIWQGTEFLCFRFGDLSRRIRIRSQDFRKVETLLFIGNQSEYVQGMVFLGNRLFVLSQSHLYDFGLLGANVKSNWHSSLPLHGSTKFSLALQELTLTLKEMHVPKDVFLLILQFFERVTSLKF